MSSDADPRCGRRMSELAVTLLRLGYLILLWVFVLSAIGVLRRDLYGTKITSRGAQAPIRRARAASGSGAAQPATPAHPRGRDSRRRASWSPRVRCAARAFP